MSLALLLVGRGHAAQLQLHRKLQIFLPQQLDFLGLDDIVVLQLLEIPANILDFLIEFLDQILLFLQFSDVLGSLLAHFAMQLLPFLLQLETYPLAAFQLVLVELDLLLAVEEIPPFQFFDLVLFLSDRRHRADLQNLQGLDEVELVLLELLQLAHLAVGVHQLDRLLVEIELPEFVHVFG